MRTIKIPITGIGSLLMHNPAVMQSHSPELKRGGKKIPLPYDEAKAGLYVLNSGQLYAKADWFREAGLIAAAQIKDPTAKGRTMMGRRFSASVFLCVEHLPLFRASSPDKPITEADEDWEIDSRRVVIQKNGIIRSRPKISDWRCDVEFEIDDEIIKLDEVVKILNDSGKYPGVGDYRVGKKGMFGRYKVNTDVFGHKETKPAKALVDA